MKIPFPRLLVATALLVAPLIQSFAIGGYVNRTFNVGDNLFVNPLSNAAGHTLSNLFITAPVPNGTTVSLWNPATLSFDTTSTFNSLNGSWSLNLVLNPGTGARLTTPSSFSNPFIGELLNHDGSILSFGFINPPPYAGPNGIFLLGDKAPVAGSGEDIFLHLLGRNPNVGEQVLTLTTTSTYLGAGAWDLNPTLGVSGAVFLNVGPVSVPEPAVGALALLGIGLIRSFRRKV